MRSPIGRYVPFLVVVVLQSALMFVAPSQRGTGDAPSLVANAGPVIGSAQPVSPLDQPATAPGGPTEDDGGGEGAQMPSGVGSVGTTDVAPPASAALGPSGTSSASDAGNRCPGEDEIGIGGLGVNGLGCGLDPSDPGPWPWSRPWMLSGDRSLCAPGGELQQAVTIFTSTPCTPRFTGDNGGATSPGVTADEIVVVRYLPRYDAASQAVLASQNLYDSPEDERRAQEGFTAFIDKHFDFYGRSIRWELVQTNCAAGDATCYRNDAKAIVTEHRPFIVQAEAVQIGGAPEFFDELARRGVITVGGWGLSGDFNAERRPFRWDNNMDGTRSIAHIAEYWCKRMSGRPADMAGDPELRTATRRLGITVSDVAGRVELGEQLQQMLSGQTCGDPAQPPVLIKHSPSTGDQSNQSGATAVRLKQEGVTTVVALDPGFLVLLTVAMDQQRYHPEHLISGLAGMDYDLVGRLNSQNQWRNAFGLSHRPKELPKGETDDWLVVRDALGPDAESCNSCPGTIEYELQIAGQLLWAGPNLTPLTFERGSLEAPQLNGYTNPDPWPGWRCCEPAAVAWRFAPGDYSANEDLKEIWWDASAVSQIDGQPGTYRCEAACTRYLPGEWPSTSPVPSRPR